jgi:putative transposase
VQRVLTASGIDRRSYYHWLEDEAWSRQPRVEPSPPVSPNEALTEEKQATIAYARKHPELRHRESAWRMVDEDAACLSPSTVYSILREAKSVCSWRRRTKGKKALEEKAWRPDQQWATDLMHLPAGERVYNVISLLDEYSRLIVHHELLWVTYGLRVSTAAQKAIGTLCRALEGQLEPVVTPKIRSDNGSC